jgi:hypothetical protein
MVQKGSRDTVCVGCKRKKKACSIKGLVSRLVAAGELATVDESRSLDISNKEDVMRLGLERGSELVLLQLLSLQQDMCGRLKAIETQLRLMQKGGADDEDEDAVV